MSECGLSRGTLMILQVDISYSHDACFVVFIVRSTFFAVRPPILLRIGKTYSSCVRAQLRNRYSNKPSTTAEHLRYCREIRES